MSYTGICEAVRLCGGENVFARRETLAPTVNVQAVIAAVARDKLYFVPPGPIQRHTPRLLDSADRMCQRLETVRGRRVGR